MERAAIEPSNFCQSVQPMRYHGPHLGQRLSLFHAHVNPLPELPALTHIHEAWCRPDHLVPPHIHATHEITYVISGRGHWQVEGQSLEVGAGDLWVVQPGEIHSGGADPADPYQIFVLGIDPAALLCGSSPLSGRRALEQQRVAQRRQQGTLLLNEPATSFELAQGGAPTYDFGALDDRRLRGTPDIPFLFKRLIRELDEIAVHPLGSSQRVLGVLMIRALLIELFVLIARCQSSSSVSQDRFSALCAWLQTSLHTPPDVAAMATLVGLSPAHFATEFKREIGQTPHEYVLSCRLEEAARRLREEPGQSITRIALDLGFSSSQYFSVAFRNHKGCTPTQWRRNIS